MPITSPVPPTPGRMGYIGKVQIFSLPVRVMSSSLNAKQTIQFPDVVDNKIDRSLYQLGAVEVEGDVSIPIVKVGNANTFLNQIWQFAMKRDANTGELINRGDVILEYSYQMAKTFKNCLVNSMDIKCTAGERVESTMGFMGTIALDGGVAGNPIDLSPARVLTWDDVRITSNIFDTCIVRDFSININNNLSRNYTFCDLTAQGAPHSLFASNISTGKRFVQGTLGFQGWAPTDARAAQNSLNTTTDDTLTFNFGGFSKTCRHVLYEYQNIDVGVGLVTSTVNWYAMGGVADNAVDD